MFTQLQTVVDSLARLAAELEPGTLTGEEAVSLVEQLGAIRRLTDGMFAKAAKRVDDTHAARNTDDRDAASLCARLVGIGVSEARRALDTARKLEALPATDAAVREGCLSARQAQMIVDAATVNPEAECDLIATATQGLVPLLDACIAARAAVEGSSERSARQRTARRLRTWRSIDGMVEGHFRLPPETGGPLKAAIDARTQQIFRERHADGAREPHDRHAADALVALVLGSSEHAKKANFTVHIVIDHAALVRGEVSEGERCEIPGVGPVSVGWVRDLLGSAFVTAVVARGKDISTVAHLGRHVPAELQTAMIVGGRECDIEHCYGRGYLERDHSEVDHAKGGPTAYWNHAWLCYVHHRLKSRGRKLGPPDRITGKRRLSPTTVPPSAVD